MDKFEDIIKQAAEGYEAPFNPQAWENVSQNLGDSFDHMMKDSAGSYEAPFNPAAWEAVNNSLGPAYSAWKWIGGSAAVIALVAGVSYFSDNSDTENQITNQTSEEVVVHHENIANNAIVYGEESTDVVVNDSDNGSDNGSDIDENPIHPIDYDVNAGVNHVDLNGNNGNQNGNNNIVDNGGQQNNGGNQVDDPNVNQVQTDPNGNVHTDFKANAKFNMSANEICEGAKCSFTPEDVDSELKYVWNFGDGGISSTINASHKFKKAGEYTVTLEVQNPRNNKVLGSSSETIVVNELPEANFSFNRANAGIPTIDFTNEGYNSEVVLWNVKGMKQSTREDFEYTFRKKGNYTVALTTKNEFGCMNSSEQTITVDNDYNLLAGTGLNPYAPSGENTFIPKALLVMDVEFTMTIQDKTGKLVYTTQNAYEGWDGRYTEDNTMAPSGSSYIWRVVFTNSFGEKEFYEGQIFVVYN